MDLWILRPGHRIKIHGGAEAEVLARTEDGKRVRVRYLETDAGPPLDSAEDLVGAAEVETMLGVVRRRAWSEEVMVTLHYIPESEEYEGGYEAETLTGVPNDVKISGGDVDSKEAALEHLIGGLKLLGFKGQVIVKDVTEVGPVHHYKVEAS